MPQGDRSPLGDLVHYHRRRLGLTQRQLANRIFELCSAGRAPSPVSERTIAGIEQRRLSPADWRTPRLSNVQALAVGLKLQPGTSEHDAFMEAALAVPRRVRRAGAGSSYIEAGRETQLAAVRGAIHRAIAGAPTVALVEGGPGTGKSRLLAYLAREALEGHGDLAVLWATCPDAGVDEQPEPADAAGPLRQHLRLLLGAIDLASPRELIGDANGAELRRRAPEAARALVEETPGLVTRLGADLTLWQHDADPAIALEVRARAEALVRQRGAAEPTQASLPEQYARLVGRYAAAGPVILVVDDLQWADRPTLVVITNLVRWLRERALPVAVLLAARPESAADGEPATLRHHLRHLVASIPGGVRVDLTTAARGEAGEAFVQAILARERLDDHPELAERLVSRTGGHPLFVTTLLRMQRKAGVVDAAALGHALDGPTVPVEIAGMLREQLHRLPPDAQRLLQVASVQGQRFAAEPLLDVLDLPRERGIALLDTLLVRDLRLVAPAGAVTIAGHPLHRYEFDHVLLWEAVAGDLTELERTDLHGRTAEAFVARYGAEGHEATGAIAHHLDQAGAIARAAAAHCRAGVFRLARRQHEAATRHFARAYQLDVRAIDPETHVRALLGLGNSARAGGDVATARDWLEKGRAMAVTHGLTLLEGHLMESLALLDFDAGAMQAGIDRLGAVIERFSALGDRDETIYILTNLAHLLYGQGRFEEAEGHARRAAGIAERVGNDRLWVEAWNLVGICRLDLGAIDEALAMHQECAAVSERVGDVHRLGLAWLNIAQGYFEQEAWVAAREAAARVLETPESTSPRLLASGHFNAGVAAEGFGDLEAARAHYETARRLRALTEQEAMLIDALAGLARVDVATGQLAAAARARAELDARLVRRGGVDGVEHPARLYLALMEVAQAMDDGDAAARYREEGVAVLMARANAIRDRAQRECFLRALPAHRRLLGLRGC